MYFLEKLRSESIMSRSECSSELRYVTSAICNSAEFATQSAYLVRCLLKSNIIYCNSYHFIKLKSSKNLTPLNTQSLEKPILENEVS